MFKLLQLLNRSEKVQAVFLFVLMLFVGILDAIGIASIMPFFTLISDPDVITSNKYLNYLFTYFDFRDQRSFVIFTGLVTLSILVISMGAKALMTYLQLRFSMLREHSMGERLFSLYMSNPYIWFVEHDRSAMKSKILSEINQVVHQAILPALHLVSNLILTLFICLIVILINPKPALIVSLVIISSYFLIYKFLAPKVRRISDRKLRSNTERFFVINEALRGIKTIKTMNLENYFMDSFTEPSKAYALSVASGQIFSQLPRFFIEAVGFGGLIFFVILNFGNGTVDNYLPVLSLYAFAGYKLLPAVQQIYKSTVQIKSSKASTDSLLQHFSIFGSKKKSEGVHINLTYKHKITLENVLFYYPNTKKPAVKVNNVEILQGSRIVIVGESGSGKSTLVDLILGLLTPSSGCIAIDGVPLDNSNILSWRSKIGYVPQETFITNGSLYDNISLGKDLDPNGKREIEDLVEKLGLKSITGGTLANFNNLLGDAGSKLSGGQKQRIGIARALFQKPEVLILDEATSALDVSTEKLVLDYINRNYPKLTVISISHRLSSLVNSDSIIIVKNGIITETDNYDDILMSETFINKNNQNDENNG